MAYQPSSVYLDLQKKFGIDPEKLGFLLGISELVVISNFCEDCGSLLIILNNGW